MGCMSPAAMAQKYGLGGLNKAAQTVNQLAKHGLKLSTGGSPALHLGVEQQAARAQLNASRMTVWQSAFRARAPQDETAQRAFSGALFTLNRQEVYGVIAAHALAGERRPSIGRWFFADVFLDGKWTSVPAQVVQLSAPATWDVALVKFRPQDAARLKPLLLSTQVTQPGEALNVTGFHHQTPVALSVQGITEITPFSLRAPIVGSEINRIGLCGSAVTNTQGELVGIHTGSKFGFYGDIGYATHAEILPKLVEAYHHAGQVFWPLELNGHKIADLRLDEYVYTLAFLDETKTEVETLTFNGKFSFSQVKNVLAEHPDVRYMKLNTAYISWQKENPNEVKFYTPARQLTYDLRESRLIN